MKKVKHIPDNELRVIKIGTEALRELVYETIIDRLNDYFDLLSASNKPCVMRWDDETGDLLFSISEKRMDDLDYDKLNSILPYTTESLFSPDHRRYRTVHITEDGEFVLNDSNVESKGNENRSQ